MQYFQNVTSKVSKMWRKAPESAMQRFEEHMDGT